ncbi:hypothetical protein SteCoe_18706 [Stentor coeruleus]|uniref:Uncharacterized protein n=1 Tax=Stentor coeruleus TaxID=5963 RepID=A0A1R2B723_9CILI|nr:hypothetical protein SteCoe_28979 [Stentor coeruleus]OMJ80944.1 hypothetical protein SteCoe_18706 [Stentor coeruleus]
MIPRWFLRSRFWFINLLLDEYVSRDAMAILGATLIMHVPMYFWGMFVNRETEIYHSHINYQNEYAPRRNRLAHSLIFEEFEMQVEQWKGLNPKTE